MAPAATIGADRLRGAARGDCRQKNTGRGRRRRARTRRVSRAAGRRPRWAGARSCNTRSLPLVVNPRPCFSVETIAFSVTTPVATSTLCGLGTSFAAPAVARPRSGECGRSLRASPRRSPAGANPPVRPVPAPAGVADRVRMSHRTGSSLAVSDNLVGDSDTPSASSRRRQSSDAGTGWASASAPSHPPMWPAILR